MKRFVFLVMMVAAVMFSLSIAHCEAKDVWVDRWQNSNADIYMMDETLAWEENLNGSDGRYPHDDGFTRRQVV